VGVLLFCFGTSSSFICLRYGDLTSVLSFQALSLDLTHFFFLDLVVLNVTKSQHPLLVPSYRAKDKTTILSALSAVFVANKSPVLMVNEKESVPVVTVVARGGKAS
jgi:hypothetical protein